MRDQADMPPSCSGAVGAHGRTSPIPSQGRPTAARGDTSDPRGTRNPREDEWAKDSANVGDGTFSALAASGTIVIRVNIAIRNRCRSKAKFSVWFELVNLAAGAVLHFTSSTRGRFGLLTPLACPRRSGPGSETSDPSSSARWPSSSGLGPRANRPNAAALGAVSREARGFRTRAPG